MEGCGNFGMPVLDTTDERVRVWYFPVVVDPDEAAEETEGRYSELLGCVRRRGWRSCTHLATLWLNQSLPSVSVGVQAGSPG
jgi:hypothetical protein